MTTKLIRQLATVLMLLVCGVSSAATYNDPGGGTYEYNGLKNH